MIPTAATKPLSALSGCLSAPDAVTPKAKTRSASGNAHNPRLAFQAARSGGGRLGSSRSRAILKVPNGTFSPLSIGRADNRRKCGSCALQRASPTYGRARADIRARMSFWPQFTTGLPKALTLEICRWRSPFSPNSGSRETVSGSSAIEQRPGFARLWDRLEQDDALIVTNLDRLGRSDCCYFPLSQYYGSL